VACADLDKRSEVGPDCWHSTWKINESHKAHIFRLDYVQYRMAGIILDTENIKLN
jgi:hypothetical protein